jgi:hypothetical protein
MASGRVAGFASVAAPVVALLVALTAGCAGGPGDAGNTPVLRGPVPPTPTPVAGPAVIGRVQDTTARSAGGATVVITVLLSKEERDERNLKSAASLGLGCLDAVGCTSPTTVGRVAMNGAFALAMPTGTFAATDPIAVTVVDERSPSARVATMVRVPRRGGATRLDAGLIPIAARPATLRRSPVRDALVMPAVAASTGPPTVEMSRAERERDAQFVQRPPTTDVSGGYDPRLVEDGMVLLAGRQSGSWGGRSFEFSASLVTTGVAVPASRGASCYVEGGRGQRIVQHPCGLTDGVLDQRWSLQDDPRCSAGPCRGPYQQHVRDTTVVLAAPVRAGLLVIRGCGDTCRVGVSTDGKSFGSWREAGEDSPDGVFAVRPGRVIVAVRIETATGGFFDSLREVSVFR